MRPPRLLRLVWVLVLWAAAPRVAWGGPDTKVFPLSAAKELPAGLEELPERLTNAVAKIVGAEVTDSSIKGAALAAGCSLDDSTCLDRIARAHRAQEIVFGTIRVADDQRVFVKLTRFIAGTERRERTFALTQRRPAALAKQLGRSARELFDLAPTDEVEEAAPRPGAEREPAGPRKREPAGGLLEEAGVEPRGKRGKRAARRPRGELEDPAGEPAPVRRGRVTRGTYFLLSGGAMSMLVGGGFAIGAYALRDDLENARRTTPDDTRRIAAIERARRMRATVATVLLASGGAAVAGGVVRALIQRRPIDDDRGLSIVPVDGGAAVVFSGRLP